MSTARKAPANQVTHSNRLGTIELLVDKHQVAHYAHLVRMGVRGYFDGCDYARFARIGDVDDWPSYLPGRSASRDS